MAEMNFDTSKLLSNSLYLDDLKGIADLDLPWKKISSSSILISGATGMLGSMLIDSLLQKNRKEGTNCKIYAIGRCLDKLISRFSYWKNEFGCNLFFLQHDINDPLDKLRLPDSINYIIHLASNTHPVAYATDPVGTILSNVYGTKNLLECAVKKSPNRFIFASSNEIYGENRGDTEMFNENYCGYIDCNTLRAGYPESKRCGEALCQAYCKQFGVDVVIPRFTRSYGPTLQASDTKALSQFLQKALAHQNIVLKSDGMQYFSYTYAADAVSGLLTVMLKGENGEAYNIADAASDVRLKDLAEMIAYFVGQKVVFELPDAVEKSGFSKATKARLDSQKLQNLGWRLQYPIKKGIERTISILQELISDF